MCFRIMEMTHHFIVFIMHTIISVIQNHQVLHIISVTFELNFESELNFVIITLLHCAFL
jgi:hypothetical protein